MQRSVDGIKPQKVGVGFRRTEIVDRHEFHVGAFRFNHCAENHAADATEPV
jgi:hypothetical protein